MSKPAKKAEPVSAPAPSLAELARRWASAKVMEETGKREADALRAELLAAGVAAGYEDEQLVVRETTFVDLEDKRIAQVLRDESLYEKCLKSELSLELVRAAAAFNDRLRRAIANASSPRLRFEQAAKKTR